MFAESTHSIDFLQSVGGMLPKEGVNNERQANLIRALS